MLLCYDAIPLRNNSILNYFHSCSLFSSYLAIYNMQQCALLRVFKAGVCQRQASAPGFLELFLCRCMRVCVFVYLPLTLLIMV